MSSKEWGKKDSVVTRGKKSTAGGLGNWRGRGKEQMGYVPQNEELPGKLAVSDDLGDLGEKSF